MKKLKKGVFLVSALAVFLLGAIYWFNTSQFIQRGTLLNEVYANIGDSEEYTLLDTDSQEKLVIILFKDDEMWDEIKSISSDFHEEIYYIKVSDVGSDEYYGDVKKMGTKNLFPVVLPAFYYIQNGIVADVTYGFPEYIEKELETFFMN